MKLVLITIIYVDWYRLMTSWQAYGTFTSKSRKKATHTYEFQFGFRMGCVELIQSRPLTWDSLDPITWSMSMRLEASPA